MQRGQSILRAAANVDYRDSTPADDLLNLIADYDALIVRGQTRVTAAVMEAASRLKVIGRAGVGVDNIDLEAAKKHNIAVVNAPTSTTVAVAELTVGLLLALAREIPRADAAMKQGQWLKKEFEGVELNGKTLGIIGFGRIGMEVGRRAAAFGMNVIAYDPNVSEDELEHGNAEPVSHPGSICLVRFHLTASAAQCPDPRSDRAAGVLSNERWRADRLRGARRHY